MENPEFVGFPKMPRLSREIIVTEKIDGTNACIFIDDDMNMFVGSRTRWITPQDDNYGFAKWCEEHRDELLTLGPGRHFGEWWGSGIQRGYGLPKGEKRFSLFNVTRWALHGTTPGLISISPDGIWKYQDILPKCCDVVPLLYRGPFDTGNIELVLSELQSHGSWASPGFMKPEGIVVFHTAGNFGFKKTIEKDEVPKAISGL